MKTYAQAIKFLYEQLPLFSKIGTAAIKKDLHNIQILCALLNYPQANFPSIHIAGTNGKGSISHMLASILQEAGYKVGLYTSPHLLDFRERIKVNGKMCSKQFVVDFTKKIRPTIEKIQPSFFEVTVAMAFEYFKNKKVDIAIIETGLGGRLDSTNIVQPILSIITNIDYDHQNILGDTLEAISYEKAGIIKETTPVVVGEKRKNLQTLFYEVAQSKKAPIVFAENRVKISQIKSAKFLSFTAAFGTKKRLPLQLDLTGIYQIDNVKSVLAAVLFLEKSGFKITAKSIQNGLKNVKKNTGFAGRWEKIRYHPTLVLDVGHNPAGIRMITEQLKQEKYQQLHIVVGMVKDKDIESSFTYLPKNATYYFTEIQSPRTAEVGYLKTIGEKNELQGASYKNVKLAIRAVLKKAMPKDLILVCGSVFLVGEAKKCAYSSSIKSLPKAHYNPTLQIKR